ncbi:MAG TPA: FadR/GntR family transcriptional regulator [Bryobacteraceae bacterium]
MPTPFAPAPERARLHDQITRQLALRVIQSERAAAPAVFPNESELCQQLGVSRTVLRESMKVLADKGMIEMRPRTGTRARPRSQWRLLDPDILAWQAGLEPDAAFLRDLCEVRLGIEPTAAGFAALRATRAEIENIGRCLREREEPPPGSRFEEITVLDLDFYGAVVAASHNPLLQHLSAIVREPFRTALLYTSRNPANVRLSIEAQRELFEAVRRGDPLGARKAAEQAVGLAMLAVEEVTRSEVNPKRRPARQRSTPPAGERR